MNLMEVAQGVFVIGCFYAVFICIKFTLLNYKKKELPDSVYKHLIYKRKQFQKVEDPMQEAMLHQEWLKEVRAIKLRDRRLHKA